MPPLVLDSDSDSSASNDESVAAQPRVLQAPPRVIPTQTRAPHPRMPTAPSPLAYNTRSCIQSITQETILHLLHHTLAPLTPQQTATRCFPGNILAAIFDTDTGELMEYHHLIKNPKYCTTWKNLGHLAQGIPGTVHGTNTIVFISANLKPPDCQKDVTYGQIVANYQP
jgi:hypothetical protein